MESGVAATLLNTRKYSVGRLQFAVFSWILSVYSVCVDSHRLPQASLRWCGFKAVCILSSSASCHLCVRWMLALSVISSRRLARCPPSVLSFQSLWFFFVFNPRFFHFSITHFSSHPIKRVSSSKLSFMSRGSMSHGVLIYEALHCRQRTYSSGLTDG